MFGSGPLPPSLIPINPSAGRLLNAEEYADLLNENEETHILKQTAYSQMIAVLSSPEWVDIQTNWKTFIDAVHALNLQKKSLNDKKYSERILNQLTKDYIQNFIDNEERLATISFNLYKINALADVHVDKQLAFEIGLINKIINKHRMLRRPEYQACKQHLKGYKQKYTLTTSENIFRYAISFNAGLNSGSVIYSIATSIALTIPVIVISGVVSLIFCAMIAKYFLNSYTDEDEDLATELYNHDLDINMLAVKEGLARDSCYDLVTQMRNLSGRIKTEASLHPYQPRFPEFLITKAIADASHPTLELDKLVDITLANYSPETSIIAVINQNHVKKYDSIYSRLFHANHWGPVLNFFSAAGTVFSVTKTILFLTGVTVLAGSPMLLAGVVALAAITFSVIFALKHWSYNQKSSDRKTILNKFRTEHVDKLKIQVDCLEQLKEDLSTELEVIKNHIRQEKLAEVFPDAAKEVSHVIAHELNLRTNMNGSPSRVGLFKTTKPLPPVHPEDDVGIAAAPKINGEFRSMSYRSGMRAAS
jgi:hypothetical protein